jgi:Protein of unknown function (DUF3987)
MRENRFADVVKLRDSQQIVIADEPLERELPPLEPAIPAEGLVADYLEYATRATMIPQEFALILGLFGVSAMLCGRVLIELGGSLWPPALWPVLVADPAGLKSAATKGTTAIIDDATGGSLRFAEDFTTEAFRTALAERPYGYVEHSEFGAFINAARKKDYMAGTFDFFNRVYDGEAQMSARQSGTLRLPPVAVAMISGTTWKALSTWVRADMLLEGFLTRPLYVPQVTPSSYVGLRPTQERDHALDARNRIVAGLAAINKGPVYARAPIVEFTDDAVKLWNANDEAWRGEDVDVVISGLSKRRGGTALRLATCYAAGRRRAAIAPVIDGEDMAHAIALVEFCSARMFPEIEDIAARSKTAEDMDRVLSIISRRGKDHEDRWVTRKAVMRFAHLTKWHCDNYIESLEEAGLIEIGKGQRGAPVYRTTGGLR